MEDLLVLLQEVKSKEEFNEEELRHRVALCKPSRLTAFYRVTEDGREIAFLSLDRDDVEAVVTIYELFVLRQMRDQGYGTRILLEIESLARRESFRCVTVFPRPLDNDRTMPSLIRWYERRGYRAREGAPEFEKNV
ncbi:GNAT family N-acetyltransferase [Bradyrhizobium sp. 81013]|nr:GNAT family N-acetyltransferase [Bradyrhizobium aeschynomenes]